MLRCLPVLGDWAIWELVRVFANGEHRPEPSRNRFLRRAKSHACRPAAQPDARTASLNTLRIETSTNIKQSKWVAITGHLGAATGPTSAAMPATDLKVILTNDDGPISPFFDAWVMHVRNRLKWVPQICDSLAAWTHCLCCPIGFGDWCAAVQMECCGLHTVARAEFRVQVHHLLALPGTASAFAIHWYGACPADTPKGSCPRSQLRNAQVHKVGAADWHIDGSPATCANLAVYGLVPDANLVLSGPNIGHNAGRYALPASDTLAQCGWSDCL